MNINTTVTFINQNRVYTTKIKLYIEIHQNYLFLKSLKFSLKLSFLEHSFLEVSFSS